MLNKLINEKGLDNLIDQISFAKIENFSQVEALIESFGITKSELLKKIIDKNGLDNLIDQINTAKVENLKQAADLINAFGSRKEELLKELVDKNGLDNLIVQISAAKIENFGQVEALINSFENTKGELLNELIDKKGLGNLIAQITTATVKNFKQAADLINAFGERKEELLRQIDFGSLNKEINNWQPSDLLPTAEFILAIGTYATSVLVPFSEEKFIALVPHIKSEQIRSYTAIFSKLPRDLQSSLLEKIRWKELLAKSPVYHFFHLNNITRVMQYYLKQKGEKGNPDLVQFLSINHDAIRKMISKTESNNYRQLFNSILILCKVNTNEIAEILNESIKIFCGNFEIPLGARRYISRLLYLFYIIDPAISYKMIFHDRVKNEIKKYFCSEKIHEIPEGTEALIKAIRNSNRNMWENEFMKDPSIIFNLKDYDLLRLYEEQNEERKQMNSLGLDYFKIDSPAESEDAVDINP